MKKIVTALNALLFAAVLLGMMRYMQIGTLRLKGTVSAGFTALCAINVIYSFLSPKTHRGFPVVMLAGLVFAMLGDIWLGIEFLQGVAFFVVGHVFYFTAFCILQRLHWLDAVMAAVFVVLSLIILNFVPSMRFANAKMERLLTGYGVVISIMAGKAMSNALRQRTLYNVLIALGSVMFYFSDVMLALRMFAGAPLLADRLCLITYFPGQAMLAHAVFYYVSAERKKIHE